MIAQLSVAAVLLLAVLTHAAPAASDASAAAADDFASSLRPRVVNGSDASIDSYPYMVSIRRNNFHSCGGTAINPFWVLTAAHCTQSRNLTAYSIRYGYSDIGSGVVDENTINVLQIWNHENYNATNRYIHDISLIRTERAINLYTFATLPRRQFEDYVHGASAKLIGWGLNETGGAMQQQLQQVDLMVFSDEECAARHSERPPHASNVCGGVPEGGRGQCSGDSGGPLLLNGIEIGIVSWSVKPCTVYPYPGVYTQVSYYREWIRHRTGI